MVDFVEKFDFVSATKDHVQGQDMYKEPSISDETIPKIIGQERNGIILFTWHSRSTSKTSKRKTHISLYDTGKQVSVLLFTHNDDIDIVNASVNQEKILLAFTVRESQCVGGNISPGDPLEIFKSYLAEIAPSNRVFSLNIEWHTYQKVQFLYNPKPTSKKIHMLFVHHKESIGLYHVPVAKLGDAGYIMSSQPKTEQIVRQFVWCQFDVMNQRLYFIQLSSQDEEDINAAAMFSVVQFTDPGEFKYILNFLLPLSFKMELMQETVKYFDSFISDIVANRNLNIQTLSGFKGELAICYQHMTDDMFERSADSTMDDDTISVGSMMPGGNSIEYSVCCLHGGYTIRVVVSLKADSCHDRNSRVFFNMFGDYIMVCLPGEFLHLLDCSSEHKPMHHIFLTDENFNFLPRSSNNSLISQVYFDYVPASQHGVLFFDNQTQITYKLAFNHRFLVTLFSKTRQSAARLALLHAAIVHIKDSSLVKSFMECLCQDPANVECEELLKEYLIASAYANMKRLLSKLHLLKALPLSCTEPFRGQMERDRDSDRTMILTYKKFRKEMVDVLLSLLRGREVDYWCSLKENITTSHDAKLKRFHLKQLAFLGLKISQPMMSLRKTTLIKSMGSREAGKHDSQSLKEDSQTQNDFQTKDEAIIQVVIEKISSHILQCFPHEKKGKVHNVSLEYAQCRGKVVKSFWRHISKVLDYSSEADVLKAPLESTNKSSDFALFQIFERLHTCVAQLSYPEFRDMSNVFISLAYRCLPLHLFMQYLNASVFTVRPEFVQRFVMEVPDTEEVVPVKIELASRLPKQLAKAVLINWKHPVANRFIAQELVSRYDCENLSAPGNSMAVESQRASEQETERFLPLETFLRAISDDKPFESHRLTEQELEFIESTAISQMDLLSISNFKTE